jgi:hypothetical protein
MATREAACHCGQLRLEVAGDPFVVSICHCLACQRRTGSAFGMQAAFTPDQVQVVGRFSDFVRISDEADRKEHVFHFCPSAARRSSTRNRQSRTWSSSRSARSPTRRSPRRRNRATSHDGIRGSVCLTRSNATTRELQSGLRSTLSTRLASTPRRPTAGASCSRGIRIPGCSTTSPAARASRAGQPTPSSTYDGRSTCGRAVAKWRSRTPTSIRSATGARSRN